MARRPDSAAPSARHPSQLLALAIGAIYTLVGLLGFFIAVAGLAIALWPARRTARRGLADRSA